ncbi:MAG: preprotein translocase subunit SecD [Methylococcaceae bacterium NSP1-2]|nr:MAG: preprotein translocase subunit SecD [Methylococcaceae bacterium NSP1-2]
MQNHFPLWKNILILIIFLVSLIYALPNLYGDDPSVQVSSAVASAKLTEAQSKQIEAAIKTTGVATKAFEFKNDHVLARFTNTDEQMKVADALRDTLGDNYTVALNLAPTTPSWLRALGADAMYLGLDLRGGVHFLLEVDMDAAVKQAEERYVDDVRIALRAAKVHYQSVAKDSGYIKVTMKTADEKAEVMKVLDKEFRTLDVTEPPAGEQVWLKISDMEIKEIKKFAVAQNMTTLRNRVNELGVAEPVIQQQGENRIVIQLPGVQDTTRAKEILGTTATLEYRPFSRC